VVWSITVTVEQRVTVGLARAHDDATLASKNLRDESGAASQENERLYRKVERNGTGTDGL
jgi:hypothetical protein